MADSDKTAAVVVNVPLACGSVLFVIEGIWGSCSPATFLTPWEAASFALAVLTPFLSIAAVWSVARIRVVLLAIPGVLGSILQIEGVFSAARVMLSLGAADAHKDSASEYGQLFLLYFLYFCALVTNAVLLILRCAVPRRPRIPEGTP